MKPWLTLLAAGLFEVAWGVGLRYTQGLTRLWPSVLTLVAYLLSFWLLAKAVHQLPLAVAYTVWVGVGIVGTTLLAWQLFGERLSPVQLACIALIAIGAVGLKATTPPGSAPQTRAVP